MCCETEGHHGGHHHGGGCGCGCGCSHSGPAFWTKAEKIARLEQVLAAQTPPPAGGGGLGGGPLPGHTEN
jgi:hypothetical protein